MGVGAGHAFITALSYFHPGHFLCVFFVDCDKGLSSSSNPPYRNKNDFYIEIKTLQQPYSRSYGTASVA